MQIISQIDNDGVVEVLLDTNLPNLRGLDQLLRVALFYPIRLELKSISEVFDDILLQEFPGNLS